jgi:hypothetical protein
MILVSLEPLTMGLRGLERRMAKVAVLQERNLNG